MYVKALSFETIPHSAVQIRPKKYLQIYLAKDRGFPHPNNSKYLNQFHVILLRVGWADGVMVG